MVPWRFPRNVAQAVHTSQISRVGKPVHLDGLNLSRAWMLAGIAHGLPPGDARIPALQAAAARHAGAALPAVTGQYYEGGHWLGTFAVYLTSRAGLEP